MNLGGAVRINRCGLVFVIATAFIIILYTFGGRGQGPGGEGDNPPPPPGGRGGGFYNGFINSAAGGVIQSPLTINGVKDHGKVSLKALLVASIDVAIRGGQEVIAVRKSTAQLFEHIKGKTKEGVKDTATEGDYRSHRVMYYGLRKAFPGVKVISEEHTEAPADLSDVTLPNMEDEEISNYMTGDDILNSDDVSIWIDPLDATKEYTENLLEYVTTMVGVAIKGKPVIGVIHRPFQEETYWAVAGYGNSLNLNKAATEQLSNNPPSEGDSISKPLRIIFSRSHAGNVQDSIQTVLGSKNSFKIFAAAGAGYKVLEVIKDQVDAYIHVTAIKKWDLCAGYAMISAMGGAMSTLNGESIDFSGDTEPLNTKGILAYMKSSNNIQKLKTIKINES